MTDFPMQPKLGTLTRITDVIRRDGKSFVYVIDYCGTIGQVRLSEWSDGSKRPQRCAKCARAKMKRAGAVSTPRRGEPSSTWMPKEA